MSLVCGIRWEWVNFEHSFHNLLTSYMWWLLNDLKPFGEHYFWRISMANLRLFQTCKSFYSVLNVSVCRIWRCSFLKERGGYSFLDATWQIRVFTSAPQSSLNNILTPKKWSDLNMIPAQDSMLYKLAQWYVFPADNLMNRRMFMHYSFITTESHMHEQWKCFCIHSVLFCCWHFFFIKINMCFSIAVYKCIGSCLQYVKQFSYIMIKDTRN